MDFWCAWELQADAKFCLAAAPEGEKDWLFKFMLPLANRLKEDRDFKKVLRFGTFFGSRNLRLKVMLNKRSESRFGFVIGNKIDKRAAVRNRIKRQLREVIRLLFKQKKIRGGVDVVININTSLLGKKYQEIKEEINYLLAKARLFQ